MRMKSVPDRTPRLIARQLAVGFGAVGAVSAVMCVLLVAIIYSVSGHVAQMRDDETSIRQGLELATAVRELSLRAGQAVMVPQPDSLDRYQKRRDQVRSQIQKLAPRIPESQQWRLPALGQQTQKLHDVLTSTALPAAQRGDRGTAQRAYTELQNIGQRAARQADALARATTSRMAHAHVLATDSIRMGFLIGGICIALILMLSVIFTLRLRRAVLHPLVVLTRAAQQFGRGDFQVRVPAVGPGELGALGEAMNRMADELAQREQRLLHNERMAAIGQLAAGIAHELNNPIGIMRGYLKTMTPGEDVQTLREELAILDEEAEHCQRIAGDLLSYARSGGLDLDELSMEDFVAETVRRFAELSEEGTPRVHVDFEPAQIRADGAKLRQVLLNLLRNARQASSPDAPIVVEGRLEDGFYRVTVEDTGAGIPAEDRERIFEPFFSRRRGGTGLGLSVCQGIVQAHGGSIEADNAGGGGARFTFRIPLGQSVLGIAGKEGSGPGDSGARLTRSQLGGSEGFQGDEMYSNGNDRK